MSDITLRNQLIRLAHSNPEFRSQLLPLLSEPVKTAASVFDVKVGVDIVVLQQYLAEQPNGEMGTNFKCAARLSSPLFPLAVTYSFMGHAYEDGSFRAIQHKDAEDSFTQRLIEAAFKQFLTTL